MQEPVWVRSDVVLAIHARQLAEHGGAEGVRDAGLLESALARPKNLWSYSGSADLAGMAASYAFGIARNHPFVDGNKRSAWVVCRTFLRLNRRDLDAPPQEAFLSMLLLAEGALSEEAFAAWVRTHLREPC